MSECLAVVEHITHCAVESRSHDLNTEAQAQAVAAKVDHAAGFCGSRPTGHCKPIPLYCDLRDDLY